MKKLNALLILAISIALFSCGGGAASNTTAEFKSDGTFLKDFTHKSTKIVLGGMVWNGKKTTQTINVGISNADAINVGVFGGFDFPNNDGEAVIALSLAGAQFEKGAEPILIKEGDVFTTGTQPDYVLSAYVTLPKMTTVMFNGESMAATKDFEGTAKITKMDGNIIEGTIDFKKADGTSSISVKFSESYEDNWTGKGFIE